MGSADVAYVRRLDVSARQQVKEAMERIKMELCLQEEAPQS
jgi:hypothetical protein